MQFSVVQRMADGVIGKKHHLAANPVEMMESIRRHVCVSALNQPMVVTNAPQDQHNDTSHATENLVQVSFTNLLSYCVNATLWDQSVRCMGQRRTDFIWRCCVFSARVLIFGKQQNWDDKTHSVLVKAQLLWVWCLWSFKMQQQIIWMSFERVLHLSTY